jgi:hypothetical protein
MVAEIFRIHENEFVPTNNALAIPEFKALWKNVDNPELYFLYIHYLHYPTSAYAELKEGEKEAQLLEDFPIDKEDPYFILAEQKAAILYNTPLKRGFKAAKKAYDLLSMTMDTLSEISLGKDGTYADVNSYLNNADKHMTSFIAVEKKYKSEVSSYGSREIAFDDKIDYSTENIDLN